MYRGLGCAGRYGDRRQFGLVRSGVRDLLERIEAGIARRQERNAGALRCGERGNGLLMDLMGNTILVMMEIIKKLNDEKKPND